MVQMYKGHRVGVVLGPDYTIGNQPNLINGIRLLVERGYEVDVLVREHDYVQVQFDSDRVHTHLVNEQPASESGIGTAKQTSASKGNTVTRLMARVWGVVTRLEAAFPGLPLLAPCRRAYHLFRAGYKLIGRHAPFVRLWLRVTRHRDYVCFIGVEPGGLMVATVVGILRRVPVVYYNMELLLSAEVKSQYQRLRKLAERWCNARAALTLIQDEARAEHMCADNHIPRSRVMIVPCSAMGPPVLKRSDYLRGKWSISGRQRILLYTGGLSSWARLLELVQQSTEWPQEWVLIIHGFPATGQYVAALRQACLQSNGKAILSTDTVPLDELDTLVSSGDIGIALYDNRGANFLHTGSASNKLAQYLKCGLPAIVSDFPSMRAIVETYQCGICVRDESEVAPAAHRILSNYPMFRAKAIRCFEERYDFRPHWENFMQYLNKQRL